jgi:dTDP-4-amino-4,6-dideoxygalactose transaminase
MAYMRNFGHNGPEDFECVGINGKNSEMHAAVGLVNLNYIDSILARRRELVEYYQSKLNNLDSRSIKVNEDGKWNYSYFPIIFKSEDILLKTVSALNDNWIYPRRYFFPSLSTLRYFKGNSTPVSDEISRRILCLPLYHELKYEEIDFIVRILLRVQNN